MPATMATETQTMPSAHSTPAQKFSRYRSVRQAAVTPQTPPTATENPPNSQNESVLRSMSRYRKRSSKPDPVIIPPTPMQQQTDTPARVPHAHLASLAALTGESYPEEQELYTTPPRNIATSRSRQHSNPKNALPTRKNSTSRRTPSSDPAPPIAEASHPRQVSWEAICRARARSSQNLTHEEARELLAEEDGRIRRIQAEQAAENEAKMEKRRAVAAEERRHQEITEAARRERAKLEYPLQGQGRRDIKQQREERRPDFSEAARMEEVESRDLRRGNSIRHKLGTFTKKKSLELLGIDRPHQYPEEKNLSASRRPRGTLKKSRPASDVPASKSTPSNDNATGRWIDAPVKKPPAESSVAPGPAQWVDAPVSRPAPKNDAPVLVPQYDAPVSAVNAGERHVLVKCNASSITLPVTPTTTPTDIISSAASAMSESIDLSASKLVESYDQLGLERALRNYEHVRDVMNSWDNDTQNALIIQPVANDGPKNELDAKHAPKEQPRDRSLYMYHSQRPGTWDKRWITLRSDGQVTIAKRRGQETSNICHLTDFDIYVPTHRQQTRRIKPPKKLCFAVKSQQKSNMFLNGANFVHFFATNDPAVAGEWYKAVQGWRSWYLVNILGEGQNSKRASTTKDSMRPSTARSQRRNSIDASLYRHRPSQPFQDFDHDNLHVGNAAQFPRATRSAEVFQSRKISSRDKAPPPSAFLNKINKDGDAGSQTTNQPRLPSIVKAPTPNENEISTFAPTSLLGRTHSQRQRAQREREINSGRTTSMVSVEPTTSLTRKTSTKSVRPIPKPLIDLTPQYQEPPQHIKKGRGVTAKPGQHLVDAATDVEQAPGAIVTPSAKAWRRPPPPQAQSPPHEHIPRPRRQSIDGGGGGRRRMSFDGPRHKPSMDFGRPQPNHNNDEIFIEGGLLARTSSKRAQGGAGTGHGVLTGDRIAMGRPLVDLQVKSQYVDGSLLRRVEVGAAGGGGGEGLVSDN
jgi:hypothetical protein